MVKTVLEQVFVRVIVPRYNILFFNDIKGFKLFYKIYISGYIFYVFILF